MATGLFDSDCILFTLQGAILPLTETLRLASLLRRALFSRWPQSAGKMLPEWLSGHDAQGKPTRSPHLAVFPLQKPGENRVQGLGIAVPKDLSPLARQQLQTFIEAQAAPEAKGIRLYDDKGLDCRIVLKATAGEIYSGANGATQWASITPVVLDRYPKGRAVRQQAREIITRACQRIGLPQPRDVIVHRHTLIDGVPAAADFKPLPRKPGQGQRWHCHAILTFEQPIAGPLLIGAGRFLGYGLFQPLDEHTI